MGAARILVVDDEQLIRWTLRERLQAAGHQVAEADSGVAALQHASEPLDLVLLDYKLPDSVGLSVLRGLKEIDRDLPIILMTAYSSVQNAVAAMKEGAYHYVNKPFDVDELLLLIDKALETTRLRREVRALRAHHSGASGVDAIIGESFLMAETKDLLRKVAGSPASTVLLTGESGTGKDLAAKAIHHHSDRAAGPFQNITCSALPDTLLESELFGHERGAFTDARERRAGLLEISDGGTVFLDEVGEMTPALQAQLLRFLEEKVFRRVGGRVDIAVDVRVVAATNRDLGHAVRDGSFREDLYYRLQVLPVHLPPLRERTGDIALIAAWFVSSFNSEFRRSVEGLTPEALDLLESHDWPGNVRELRNAIERAVLLAEQAELLPGDFAALLARPGETAMFKLPPAGICFEDLERELVEQALRRTQGNQTQAARLLGMNRDQVRYRIEKFGLDKPH